MARFPEIPGHKIVSELGEGGMATVYLGIQEKLDREVAIKILKPFLLKDTVTAARFEREAQTAASLSHSNIIQIFDTGKYGNYHYIIMEYLQESLKDHMKRTQQGKMHPQIALDIVEAIMKALDYAHFRGVYHRDIKPDNIMFRQDSTPVLVDFGIARVFESLEELTQIGIFMGTPNYMSPEQCNSQPVDGRSDIYSLGVVFFEMLTGKRPYEGTGMMQVAFKHVNEPVPTLPQALSSYQPLIEKMMAIERQKRLSSGAQFVQLLDRIMMGSITPQRQPVNSSAVSPVEASSSEPPGDHSNTTTVKILNLKPSAPSKEKKSFFFKFLDLIKKKLDSFIN